MESKNRKLKVTKVAEIKEKMEKAKIMVLSKYQGLTVEEVAVQTTKNATELFLI